MPGEHKAPYAFLGLSNRPPVRTQAFLSKAWRITFVKTARLKQKMVCSLACNKHMCELPLSFILLCEKSPKAQNILQVLWYTIQSICPYLLLQLHFFWISESSWTLNLFYLSPLFSVLLWIPTLRFVFFVGNKILYHLTTNNHQLCEIFACFMAACLLFFYSL